MNTVTSKDGTKIAYDKVGQGPALILVAGAFSYRKFPGQVQLANLLSERFTVYNYDRRGRGDSGDTKPYAIKREIEDLEAMIDEAGGTAYESPLSLRRGAQALAGVLPNAQLLSKKGLGHTKKLDAKSIAAELAAFF